MSTLLEEDAISTLRNMASYKSRWQRAINAFTNRLLVFTTGQMEPSLESESDCQTIIVSSSTPPTTGTTVAPCTAGPL